MKPRPKTEAEHFIDWEGFAFGYGYGTGEPHVLPAVRRFLELCNERGVDGYDYRVLQAELSPAVAWLLVNALARADVLEYGTSPRHGWLTASGRRLRAFVLARSADQLVDLVTEQPESYAPCFPNACNCGPRGYERGRVCDNPFWREPANQRMTGQGGAGGGCDHLPRTAPPARPIVGRTPRL